MHLFIYLKPHKKLTKTKDNAMDTESNTHAESIMTGSTSEREHPHYGDAYTLSTVEPERTRNH